MSGTGPREESGYAGRTRRGYFGIGVENLKNGCNLGTLWRSAYNLGASFIFTVGRRYRRQASDTVAADRHIPLYEHDHLDDFLATLPRGCVVIGAEYPHERAVPLTSFSHPRSCVYLLGSEDNGLTEKALGACHGLVYIPSRHCLNVSAAGSVVMYDRMLKEAR